MRSATADAGGAAPGTSRGRRWCASASRSPASSAALCATTAASGSASSRRRAASSSRAQSPSSARRVWPAPRRRRAYAQLLRQRQGDAALAQVRGAAAARQGGLERGALVRAAWTALAQDEWRQAAAPAAGVVCGAGGLEASGALPGAAAPRASAHGPLPGSPKHRRHSTRSDRRPACRVLETTPGRPRRPASPRRRRRRPGTRTPPQCSPPLARSPASGAGLQHGSSCMLGHRKPDRQWHGNLL